MAFAATARGQERIREPNGGRNTIYRTLYSLGIQRETYSSQSPSSDDSLDARANGSGAHRNRNHVGSADDLSCGVDESNIVGQSVGIKVGMGLDELGVHGDSSVAQTDRSHHAEGVGNGSASSAVCCCHYPTRIVDPAAAKVRVGRGTQRDHVGKLSRSGIVSTQDARVGQGCVED